MAKVQQNTQSVATCVGADAALSPLHLPAPVPAFAKAGIPFHHFRGRFAKLPLELKQTFMPYVEPCNLERLQRGELQRLVAFVPHIGALRLERKNNEIWATFTDALEVAYQFLQASRLFALAVRYQTLIFNPEGGVWCWLPKQVIFPPDFCLTRPCVDCQVHLLERSPPLWRQGTDLRRQTPDEAQHPVVLSRWLTPSVPRALRAPNRAARLAWRVAGQFTGCPQAG